MSRLTDAQLDAKVGHIAENKRAQAAIHAARKIK